MSDTMKQSLWYKMRYTPIRDALRGQITTRLDLRRALEAAALPPPVKQLIRRVVEKTRLWRLEKLEVTQELISHFADGLKSGGSPDQLIQAFGDESLAATLLRRAKRRNRPVSLQVLRVAGWSTATMLLFYFGFAVYFFAGYPSPRMNYVASVNQRVEKTPPEDRAWPMYRRALVGLGPLWRQELPAPRFEAGPGANEWQFLAESVAEHQTELEWIRQGAAKPELGFLIGANGSLRDPELWPDLKPEIDPVTGQELTSVQLPPLQALRNLGNLLRADAVLARQARDEKRLLRDMNSLLGLSHQVGDHAPLLCGMVSLSIYDAALDQIEQTLRNDPALIENENWIALAQRLSRPKVAGDMITLDMERMSFEDMLQRSFTDDGSGNGRLTPQGVAYFRGSIPGNKNSWLGKALQPPAVLLVASRQTLAKEYARLADRAAANLRLPMRDIDWRSVQEDLNASSRSALGWMGTALLTSSRFSQETTELKLGRRDGLLAAIGLEVFRREHGRYPDDLNALVPQLLPEVPADRITGEPVRFRIEDSHPLIYSVGADRNDDGGRTARPEDARISNRQGARNKTQIAAVWETSPEPAPDGDWVLYPVLK